MRRWEREDHDARLDAVKGSPCPVCGDASLEGSGPCSESCEMAVEERAERRREIGEELRGERFDAVAERGW